MPKTEITMCIKTDMSKVRLASDQLLLMKMRKHIRACRIHMSYIDALRGPMLLDALENFERDVAWTYSMTDVVEKIKNAVISATSISRVFGGRSGVGHYRH